jgi:hypothetical protein
LWEQKLNRLSGFLGVKTAIAQLLPRILEALRIALAIVVELTMRKKPASVFSVNVAEHGLEVSSSDDQSPF